MKFRLLVSSLLLSVCTYAQTHHVHGKIIDEDLQNAVGTFVTNLSTHAKSVANRDGLYSITASIGDTLRYSFVGVADEKRVVLDASKPINVVLMNKAVNDLGAVWTKQMWSKAERQIARRYQKLEKEAQKLGKWNY